MENWQLKKIINSEAHQIKSNETIDQLVLVSRNGRKMQLADGRTLTEFISCSYLGLDQDIRVTEAAGRNFKNLGVSFPAARARVLTQNEITLETLLNNVFCGASCVVFQNLHQAHLGFFPLLGSGRTPSFPIAEGGPVFIIDQTAHASIQINRGLLAQFGEVRIVDFTKIDCLEAEFRRVGLEKNKTPIAIADSVGSMGGVLELAPLLAMLEQYNGYAYLDDAHGTSVFGRHGCGYVLEQLNYKLHPRLILACSLAKAFGAGGGGVLAFPQQPDSAFVKAYCSTYIFGGPPALAVIDAAIASAQIHLSDELNSLQRKLQTNLALFDSLIKNDCVINYQTSSPLRGVLIGDEFAGIEFALKLREKGIAITMAMYPRVKKGKSMARIALGATHTQEEIFDLCTSIYILKK